MYHTNDLKGYVVHNPFYFCNALSFEVKNGVGIDFTIWNGLDCELACWLAEEGRKNKWA